MALNQLLLADDGQGALESKTIPRAFANCGNIAQNFKPIPVRNIVCWV